MRHPFRRKTLRPRLLPVYLLGGLLFWLATPTPAGFVLGVALVAGGEALRVWGAGHLVKNDVLTVTGPYAHVRNPLYTGTLLVGAGFCLAAGGPAALVVLPLGTLLFFVYYFPYKERIESARLERLYGAPYTLYRASVPALVPALAAWSPPAPASGAGSGWSLDRFRENDEDGTLLAVTLGVLALAVRPWLPLA